MRIKAITVWPVDIPLRISFKHSLAVRNRSNSVFVRVELENGVCGYGEALPRSYVTGETVLDCLQCIQQQLIPRLIGLDIQGREDLSRVILGLHEDSEIASHLAAICCVELALLDALARSQVQDIYTFLAVKRTAKRLRFSMVLGESRDRTIKRLCWLTRLMAIRDIKLKVGSSLAENERRLRLIKKICSQAHLRVDANCAWTLDEARRHLDMMRSFGVLCCEQPLAKRDYSGLARLVVEYPDILIGVDESLCSFSDAKELVRQKAATCFNLRISKNGGLHNALRIYHLAQDNGIACQLGAQVGESAVLSAAGRVLAGITGNLIFHEGSFGTRLLRQDVTTQRYHFGFGGRASTSCPGPGFGIRVIQERLLCPL